MTSPARALQPVSKGLHIALWLAQILLAAMFTMSAFPKAFAPIADVHRQFPAMVDIPAWLLRFIGFAELAGAAGLILPSLTRILPQLTLLAAGGLAIVMVLALGFHAMRGEFVQALPINGLLLALSLFVLWGRTKRASIEPRST